MGYCSSGSCSCGRCKRPWSPQPHSVLLLLLVALTLLVLSSLIKFDIVLETGPGPQLWTLVLLLIAVSILFLVCWLPTGNSCRGTYYCVCWKCSWKVRC
ncbi:hypothetical protein SLEP1_g33716 [Rubroshorea leprosula]|uniref:Uncharacterized protein n=1 Tax=Rubroshorea leprosula TaxID=152421 RepID=A0AAV5KHH4_9ROSI|nr:hypothetical protein SLEP1_g33716 [Rubroshorea leprosula]